MSSKNRFSQLFVLTMLVLLGCLVSSCGKDNTSYPRPRGYFRIDFPDKIYRQTAEDLPFSCELPTYSIFSDSKREVNQWQANLQYPRYNATLHCVFIEDSNLVDHVDFAKTMAYKHRSNAKSIEEIPFVNTPENVYGLIYEIKGEKVACNYSFYLIDSTERFFRGALYFNQAPNSDSLKPVLDFLHSDLKHMIHSFAWATATE